MTNQEILKNKIKEKFGDTELINKYVYEQCIIAGVLEAMDEAKNLHKPLVTSSYDAEDMKEAYEYGKGYGTGNFDEWLKNRNCS